MADDNVIRVNFTDTQKKRLHSRQKPTRIKIRAMQYFEVILKNDSGNLIPFQKIRATFDDGSTEIVRVDENGYYRFNSVPEGPVKIEMLDLDELYAASHAANIKKAFKGGEDQKIVVFETLKLPPYSLQKLVEIYDDESQQKNGTSFLKEFTSYIDSKLNDKEKLACYALLTRAGLPTPEKNAKYYKHGEESELDATSKYVIWSEPYVKAVIPGTKVKYYGGPSFSSFVGKDSGYEYQWFCFNDPSTVKDQGAPSVVFGPEKYYWDVSENNSWKFIGNHTICLRVQFKYASGKYDPPIYIEFQQGVKTEEAIITDALKDFKDLPDPDNALLALSKYIDLLETAAKMSGSEPLDPNFMNNLKQLRDKMIERFSVAVGYQKFPIKAVHINHETSEVTPLRVFISFLDEDIIWDDWVIIDWTNVMDRRLTGVYHGEGTVTDAIDDAIDDFLDTLDWVSANRYPKGKIRVEIPEGVPGSGYEKEFITDGSAFWDSISELLGYVALGAAIIAGVITLIAPVPGSQVISFCIWTAIAASTSSAVINIAQRHAEGFGDFKEDAIDSLTIVGNLLSGGWMVGARLTGLKQFAGSKLGKGILIGQFTSDGVQGVLVAEDFIEDYEAAMSIKDPHERTARLMEITRSALITGTMTYISLKGTAKDMELGRDFKKLGVKTEELDISKPPAIKGNTNSKLEIEVQDKGIVKENTTSSPKSRLTKGGPPSDSIKASSPESAGMPDEHFRVFKDVAVDEQKYILLRNTNIACLDFIKKGYPAKPLTVKPNTSKKKHGGSTDGLATVEQKDGILDPKELQKLWDYKDANNFVVLKNMEGDYIARNYKGDEIKLNQVTKKPYSQNELGWVIDGKSGLPFTGDYDLQDVFFKEGSIHKTKSGEQIEMLPSKAALWDVSEGKQDISNPWIKKVKEKLNERLKNYTFKEAIDETPKERVLHGADAGFAIPGEEITVFRPDGTTELLKTQDDVNIWYEKIGRKTRFEKLEK
ncbi:MAG: hypothetical protein Q7S39_09300 [Ignavibacteria bacterium]|nr:hypothetical protein [Ignavibacteria bacterium]